PPCSANSSASTPPPSRTCMPAASSDSPSARPAPRLHFPHARFPPGGSRMTPMVPPNPKPDPELVRMLEEAEQRYLRSLPPEHFMEATAQAAQREITLESFALVRAARPEIQLFSELLVQYPRKGRKKKLGQVVPDNM